MNGKTISDDAVLYREGWRAAQKGTGPPASLLQIEPYNRGFNAGKAAIRKMSDESYDLYPSRKAEDQRDVLKPLPDWLTGPPKGHCSACGRVTYADDLGCPCGMPQPDGSICGGVFA